MYNLFNNDNNTYIINKDLIKKIAIFYICLQSDIPINFVGFFDKALNKITNLNYQRIKETLIIVLHKGIKFDVYDLISYISNWIKETFVLDPNNIVFINNINNRLFTPNILFSGYKIEDVSNHSMGLRKTK